MPLRLAGDATRGARALLHGFSLIRQPGVRSFVIMPLLINVLVFATLIGLAVDRFGGLIDRFQPALPEWLAWLAWLAWILFAVLAILLVFYTFTLVANLISAPFNSLLAERVAERHGVRAPASEASFLRRAIGDLAQELRKLAYFLTRALGLGLVSLVLVFVPPVNALIPLLWFLYGAWMLALEYSDFHLANQGFDLVAERQLLRNNPGVSLGFGAAATAATLVPIVNLLVLPAAVAGATALWCERLPERRNGFSKDD